MPDTPAPVQENRALKDVLAQVSRLTGNLQHMSQAVEALRGHLDRMAQLAGRANAGLLLLAGLPRVFRSDVYHALALGSGARSNFLLGGALEAALGGGGGARGGGPGVAPLEILKLRDRAREEALHEVRMKHRKLEGEIFGTNAGEMARKVAEYTGTVKADLEAGGERVEEVPPEKMKRKKGGGQALAFGPGGALGFRAQRRAAQRIATEVLGINPARLGTLEQFTLDEGHKGAGASEPGRVGLNPHKLHSFAQVYRVTAHELAHQAQYARGVRPEDIKANPEKFEKEAFRSEYAAVTGLLEQKPHLRKHFERHLPWLLSHTTEQEYAEAKWAKEARRYAKAYGSSATVPMSGLGPEGVGPLKPVVPVGTTSGGAPPPKSPPPTTFDDAFEPEGSGPRQRHPFGKGWGWFGGPGMVDSRARRRHEALLGEHGKLAQVMAQGAKFAQRAAVAWKGLNLGVRDWLNTADKKGVTNRARLGAVSGAATTGLLVGTSVAAGALQAANPVAFDTVVGSVRLVAAQLGQVLVPAALQASLKLQEFAGWLGTWSSESKEMLGTFVKWSLVGTAAVVVTSKVIQAVQFAAQAISLAFSAGAQAVRFFSTGLGQGVLAVAGLAAAVGYLVYQIHGSEKRRREELGGYANPPSMGVGDDYYTSAVFDRANKIKDPEERRKFLKEQAAQSAADATQAGKRLQEIQAGRAGLGGIVADAMGNNEARENEKQAAEAATKAAQRAELTRKMYEASKSGKGLLALPEGLEYRQQVAKQAQGLLLSLQSFKGDVSYSGVEEAYKKTQVAALGTSPLDAAVMKIQKEALPQMLEQMGKLLELNEQQVKAMERAYGVSR